jgi:hypothetical protein
MKIKNFPAYVFWNYKKDADLPEEVVANNVFLYGNVNDMIRITKAIPKNILEKVIDNITLKNRYKKRINFIRKIILSA